MCTQKQSHCERTLYRTTNRFDRNTLPRVAMTKNGERSHQTQFCMLYCLR